MGAGAGSIAEQLVQKGYGSLGEVVFVGEGEEGKKVGEDKEVADPLV